MRYRKPINFLLRKIDTIWGRLHRQPITVAMATPSVFCERCTTENQCDECNLTQWLLYCRQFDLCEKCGVPKHLDHLSEDIHTKFTCTPSPCEACRPRQMRFLQGNGYCTVCFQKMEFSTCFTCYCMCEGEEDMCKPYECNCACGVCFQNRSVFEQSVQEEQ